MHTGARVHTSGKPRVLIVDDQDILRNLLVKFMVKAGFEPIEAPNGKKAIELYNVTRPSVILSDIMMPEMDGLTLLHEIKKIDRDAVVILMTGYGNEDILLESLRGGAVNFFKKPFDFTEVIEVVRSVVRHREEADTSPFYSPYLTTETKRFRIAAADSNVQPIINQIALQAADLVPVSEIINLKIGMEEMIKNATEHGNLGITFEEKNEAIEGGSFGELLQAKLKRPENADKVIVVESRLDEEGLEVRITDQGSGFDWRALPELSAETLLKYNGRGIFLTKIYYDEVRYNDAGNEVTLIKRRNS
jgi:DNA-binding response OmpR family regulator